MRLEYYGINSGLGVFIPCACRNIETHKEFCLRQVCAGSTGKSTRDNQLTTLPLLKIKWFLKQDLRRRIRCNVWEMQYLIYSEIMVFTQTCWTNIWRAKNSTKFATLKTLSCRRLELYLLQIHFEIVDWDSNKTNMRSGGTMKITLRM